MSVLSDDFKQRLRRIPWLYWLAVSPLIVAWGLLMHDSWMEEGTWADLLFTFVLIGGSVIVTRMKARRGR